VYRPSDRGSIIGPWIRPTSTSGTPRTGASSSSVGHRRRLHDAHALVLDDAGAIRMANPFAARPTPFRVEAGGRSWYANCAWDAFGIGAALKVDSRFETTCPDCRARLDVVVRDGRPDDDSLLFHVLVPAGQWWNDIVFT
jgi:hypothetical protein